MPRWKQSRSPLAEAFADFKGFAPDEKRVDRMLKFNPDYMLWNNPALSDRMTMESITDAGVPILTILGCKTKSMPGRIYRQNYEPGLRRSWKFSAGTA